MTTGADRPAGGEPGPVHWFQSLQVRLTIGLVTILMVLILVFRPYGLFGKRDV